MTQDWSIIKLVLNRREQYADQVHEVHFDTIKCQTVN